MILRKPYAFFIKHFKLLHIILTLLISYCIYKTFSLLLFFNEYINLVIDVKGQDLVYKLTPFLVQLLPILICLISIIILVVMFVKDKPKINYFLTIFIYVFTFIIIQLSHNILLKLNKELLDPRIIRAIRDLLVFSIIFQIIPLVLNLIRATGFDVKKFDFKDDLKNLEINEEDREEVEIQINYDKNKTIRKIRKNIRFLKYYYLENFKIVNISSLIILSIFSVMFINNLQNNQKMKVGDKLTLNNVSIILEDSYITNKNYKGEVINDNVFVILKLKMKKNSKEDIKLDLATTKLVMNNYVYTPTFDYKDSFIDLGKTYIDELLSKDYEERILIYEIPHQLKDKKKEFVYVTKNVNYKTKKFKSLRVKLLPNNLDNGINCQTFNLNNVIDYNDKILPNFKFVIKGFDIQDTFKIDYEYCIKNECMNSIEYLKPKINSNYDKSLLKIVGNITSDEYINEIFDLYDFLEKFAIIEYKVNDKTYLNKINRNEIVSKRLKEKNVYYIEVNRLLKESDSIIIKILIRNKEYRYVLK